MMESTDSSSGSQQPQLPPGFRFHPTDEELVVHYLKKKASSSPLPVPIIADVDLYKFDPWELPGKASFGDQEWYFFSPRDRKYPNGARPNRAATSGYWKATGTDKPILTSGGTQKIGVKKALVFYGGKPPKGIKTNWIMHEYRLLSSDKSNISNNNNNNTNASSSNSSSRPLPPIINKKNSLRLDDWVLCRIYKKCNSQRISMEHQQDCRQNMELQIAKNTNSDLLLENNENFFEGLLTDQGLNSNNNDNSATTSNTNTTDLLPLKRSLQASSYWINEEGKPSYNDQSSSEKFRANLNSSSSTESGNNSAVNFLANHIPQASNSSFHQHLLFGSLGDGTVDLRQPYQITGINWGS